MGGLVRFDLKKICSDFNLERLVETGTGMGNSLAWAINSGLSELYSVESTESLFEKCKQRFAANKNVNLTHGKSGDFLRKIVSDGLADTPTLYFLDTHFIGGADFGLADYSDSTKHSDSFPLLDELDILLGTNLSSSIVIIDDARIYFPSDFQNGKCPDFAQRWEESSALLERIGKLSESHTTYLLNEDDGYLILAPKNKPLTKSIINVFPHDINNPIQYQPGVNGVTAISIARRLADSRFATRWFCGNGIDVGGGGDSLALYKEFFPLASNIFVYDQEHGDAQNLANVLDESFDFLYSSHCLEHMRDARKALNNWLRVIKSGGHLVVQIPDEDLYEQGQWPSVFNPDHKICFTIAKEKSWSPVSVNLLDLLGDFRDTAEILSLQVLDHGYRYKSLSHGVDQTRTPIAECAIEFVLRKR